MQPAAYTLTLRPQKHTGQKKPTQKSQILKPDADVINHNKNYNIMYRPLITWAVLAALLIILFIVRTAIACHRHHRHHDGKHLHHILEIGSERDEFFVPGDRPTYDKSRDYEDF